MGAVVATAAVGGSVSACGGDDGGPHLSAAQREGQAAVARRHLPQGVTLTHTEAGSATPTGTLMRPLKTYAAAKTECGYWHAGYVAKVYGGAASDHMTASDYDHLAHAFAVRRAAPGRVPDVQRGCRAGLHP
jgi:hypothetical protein